MIIFMKIIILLFFLQKKHEKLLKNKHEHFITLDSSRDRLKCEMS